LAHDPAAAALPSNPLREGSPRDWDRLVESVGPASLIVAIGERMGALLRSRLEADDVWQEVLLLAWRDRGAFEWRGAASFRSWLLTIADHRIRDLLQYETAEKRGAVAPALRIDAPPRSDCGSSSSDGVFAGPVATTTPSRAASLREEANAMRTALSGLDDEVRDVVRLRLFEEQQIESIAVELGIGESAVRHRFRKGLEEYGRRLRALIASRSAIAAVKP
jgi:RNA polymerase sigma factor (sigma-70 family)